MDVLNQILNMFFSSLKKNITFYIIVVLFIKKTYIVQGFYFTTTTKFAALYGYLDSKANYGQNEKKTC